MVEGPCFLDEGALVKAGAAVTAARLNAIGLLVPHAARRYGSVAGHSGIDLGYISSWVDEGIAARSEAA